MTFLNIFTFNLGQLSNVPLLSTTAKTLVEISTNSSRTLTLLKISEGIQKYMNIAIVCLAPNIDYISFHKLLICL